MLKWVSRFRGLCFTAFVVIGSVQSADAQGLATEDHLSSDFLRPQIVAGYSSASARLFKDVDGTYDASIFSLEASVPLLDRRLESPDGPTSYLVLCRGQLSGLSPEISFLPFSRSMVLSTLGFTGGIRTSSNHLYLLTVNAGFAEDEHAVDDPKIRPTGSLLGKYQLDESFAFIYGLSYSYTFNRGLLLPLMGAHAHLTRNLEMHVVLPLSFEIEYGELSELHFGFVVRENGNQIHLHDDPYFGPQTSPIYLKTSQVQAAFTVTIGLSQDWFLCGEAGASRYRTLAIGPLDHDIISSKIENAGYSSFTVKYVLDGSNAWLW